MSKILIIGPEFHGYNEILKKTFEKYGHDCETCQIYLYSSGHLHYLHFLCKKYISLKNLENNNFIKNRVLKKFDSFNPEYVLLIKGDSLPLDAVRYMKKKSQVAMWVMDSFNMVGELTFKNAEEVGSVFVFEASDIERFKELPFKMTYLPLGYDEFTYYKIDNKEKTIDVFFVGELDNERLKILEKLVTDFPNLKMKFYGGYAKYNIPKLFKYYVLAYNRYFTNITLNHTQINEMYNQSKICLNLHRSQSKYGWNARTNEILATGAFQIVDNIPGIAVEYKDGLILFNNYDDLKQKILFYLNHSKKLNEIAQKGHKMALEKHSYSSCVEIILKTWSLL